MTLTEKRAGLSLILAICIFAYLVANMTHGWSIPDQAPRHLWRTWLVVLALATVGEYGVSTWAAWMRQRGALEDERDQHIIARADRLGLLVGFGAINVLVWQILLQSTYPTPAAWTLNVQHLPTLFVVLMGVLFIAQVVKQLAILGLGRLA
ncbi:hypothetical protein PbB2_02233 [Candidatus Phycosocius bacilliformis]|uniref:Uncharacterized protein n=1 Tax=Candidatus Phycosocius bacilliformis TaxID=1445552 RepID=A0A2P2EBV1_9PROT|nr:hypothetical protein [Candidatus Phycosocius bacilliformis]GBF58547.1 hypothetical protein PbB2_02233 [Candidatus Phycosocius bacilliformis]